nr:uncharacterized protein LOC109164890 [Ipomoea batatas]
MASFSSFAPAKNAATAPLSRKSGTPPTKNASAPSSLFFLFFCFHHSPPPPPQEHKQLEDFLDGGVVKRMVPLLRGPIRIYLKDDPSASQFTLPFKNPVSWESAYRACENQNIQQCEARARIGCSVAASQICQPPW